MATDTYAPALDWTVADLLAHVGPIPLRRIRHDPAPGTATEEDVVQIHDREKRLYELVDGVLVEKVMGYYESYLAILLARLLGNFVAERNLGIVAGSDGLMRLFPGLIRIPDISFVSWARLPGGRLSREPIADFAPDLAVEVLSPSNTRQEMERKLRDYFTAGVRLVWYVDPPSRTLTVYTAADQSRLLRQTDTLDGGSVLPGFSLPLQQLFAEPGPNPASS
jgi:Uma2 family endonuclease